MKRMIADLILAALLDISLCVPFALGSEVIYQDENVLMEKVGQMIIKDANRIFWRADEIPDAELKDLCDMAVIVEKDPANGKTTVLYPFLLYSGDYQKHTTKFINYKGEVLREEHDLDLESAYNFSSEVIMSKGSTKRVADNLWVYNHKGEELYNASIEIYPQSFLHSAPNNHVAVWSDNWRYNLYDSNGVRKTVGFDTGDSGYTILRFSNDGKYVAHCGPGKILMLDYKGDVVWEAAVGFDGSIGSVYLSLDNKYLFANYTVDYDSSYKVMLLNDHGRTMDLQKHNGDCCFYESINHEYLGILLLKDNGTTIYLYEPALNGNPMIINMHVKLTNQKFNMDSKYPILSASDGKKMLMVKPDRVNSEMKHIVRILINYNANN